MATIDDLDSLPEINLISDEELSLDTIIDEMVIDYQNIYEELTGKEITLYPTDDRRVMITAIAGKIYQMLDIMNEHFKLNFIQYMYGDYLKNWAANFGLTGSGESYATTVLRFTLSEEQSGNVTVPAGTRATAGDNVFFASDIAVVIPAGSTYADVAATCTEVGALGNDYTIGQLNIIADPVAMVASVSNTTISSGGHDEYTDAELRELILAYPTSYSTAGPEAEYVEFTKSYSDEIADARINIPSAGTVDIYIMRTSSTVPDEDYCTAVEDYIKGLKATPDTDSIHVKAPEVVDFNIAVTYYISESNQEYASDICSSMDEAGQEFADDTAASIGYDINPDTLTSYAVAAGARRIVITEPVYTVLTANQVGVCQNITLTYGGLEPD